MRNVKGATSGQILDAAEVLTQKRGFNGFSYADVSEVVGITKASLHYHFRTKAELGKRLIERYFENFETALSGIEAGVPTAPERLERYVSLYTGVLRGDRMCLCGMLAAEVTTLPDAMRDEIRRFFDMNEVWLTTVFQEGLDRGELRFEDSAQESARLLLGALEGAMLVARSYGEVDRFERSARRLLQEFRANGR